MAFDTATPIDLLFANAGIMGGAPPGADLEIPEIGRAMLVAGTKKSVLSIITGGGKWIELSIEADPIYQTILIAAEKAFGRAVKTGETPVLCDCEPPKPRIEAVGVVDMNVSNSWAEFACFAQPGRLMPTTNGPRASSGP